jgi:hypothetical protein
MILEGANTQFDPGVIKAFEDVHHTFSTLPIWSDKATPASS